jgi:hypothetical protein
MIMAVSSAAAAEGSDVGIDSPRTIAPKLSRSASLYMPDRADRLGISGSAVIECRLGELRALNECSVISESRSDQNFGLAALKMAQRRAVTAGSALDGAELSIGQLVRLTVPFHAPHR